jgi:hypothetical protein
MIQNYEIGLIKGKILIRCILIEWDERLPNIVDGCKSGQIFWDLIMY